MQKVVVAARKHPGKFDRLLEDVDVESTSVNQADKQVMSAELAERIGSPPEGEFQVILMTPLWNSEDATKRASLIVQGSRLSLNQSLRSAFLLQKTHYFSWRLKTRQLNTL